jgi:hypothetical protein
MIAILNRCIAYAAAALSAALAARYGWKVADTAVDAALRGAALFVVAIIAAHSMGWATKAWRGGSRGWGILIAAGGLICFAVTLAGGIGTIAGSNAAVRAEREYRAAAQRVTMRAEADAATGLQAAQESARRECATGRGVRCREAEAGLSAAQQRADKARAAVGEMTPTPEPDPQAASLARLLGLDPAYAGDLYAGGLSLALELGAMLALLFATLEVAPGRAMPQHKPAPLAPPARTEPPGESARPARIGSVAQFLVEALDAAPGETTDMAPLPGRYQAWCAEQGCEPMGEAAFAAEVARVAKQAGLLITRRGGRLYVMNMRLVA